MAVEDVGPQNWPKAVTEESFVTESASSANHSMGASPSHTPFIKSVIDRGEMVARAQQMLLERRRRIGTFGISMFGEPAWDMLLILYTDQEQRRFTITQLADEARVPPTTGLRWLMYLEKHNLVQRRQSPTDARASFVELTEKGSHSLETYLCETLRPQR